MYVVAIKSKSIQEKRCTQNDIIHYPSINIKRPIKVRLEFVLHCGQDRYDVLGIPIWPMENSV